MITGNSDSKKIIPYLKRSPYGIRSRSNSGRLSTSRFRGVLPLKSCQWGARISHNYKAYWLGTYVMEKDAAIAYDRAALKLQKSESPLNFPSQIYTTQEKSFQSWYSDEEILSMIKDKTYSSKFTNFLARESLVNARGIPYQLLFHKKLTQEDVTDVKGFHIPKEHALQYFPQLGENSAGYPAGNGSIYLTFCDRNHRSWTFQYSYGSCTKTFLFTSGWRHFVAMNDLKPGDTVIFYGCPSVGTEQRRRNSYMIDIHRHVAQNYVGRVGARVDGITGGAKDNGVKLFGVRIG